MSVEHIVVPGECRWRVLNSELNFIAMDVDFGRLPLNAEVMKAAVLQNIGTSSVVTTGYDRTMLDQSGEFTLEGLDEALPLTIEGGSRYQFFVRFHPVEQPGPRFVGIPLFTNGVGPDTIVVLRGEAYDRSVGVRDDEEGTMETGIVAPSPASVSGVVSIPITMVTPGTVTMTLENVEGRIIGTELSDYLVCGNSVLRLNLAAFGATPGFHVVRLRLPRGLVKTLPLILTE